MKSKILITLGVNILAGVLLLNTSIVNKTYSSVDLSSLITMNTANAETDCDLSPGEQSAECDYFCTRAQFYTCDILYLCGDGYATIRCVDGDYK